MAWQWDEPTSSYILHPEESGMPVDYPQGHYYYVWHTDEPVNIPIRATPDRYELRDWQGQLVQDGTCTTVVNLGILSVGHYRLYLFRTGQNHPTGGDAFRAINIAVWRRTQGLPNRPNRQTDVLPAEAVPVINAIAGPTVRFDIHDIAITDNQVDNVIRPAMTQLRDATRDRYLTHSDAARLHKEVVVHFGGGTEPSGSAERVAYALDRLGTDDIWYECRNEPDNGTHAQDFIPELQRFYNMVKTANPNARVLGPNQVSVNRGSLDWTRRFFEEGGGNYIDGFSFHAYNVCSGELQRGRRNADRLIALLTEFGQQHKPRWMTEWGHFASTYGSFTPMRQLRWVMTEMLFWEQYGIPKERWYYFYNKSHGFWDYPSFAQTDQRGLLSLATAMRVLSEEVYGKSYHERLHFGDEDDDFLGSRYEGSSGDVVALIACGRHGDNMIFSVGGGVTQLTMIDAMGASSTVPVTGGHVSIAIPGHPIYVRLPHGTAFTPLPKQLGTNLVRQGMWPVITSSTGKASAQKLADNLKPHDYPYIDDKPLPITLTVKLGQMTSFDTVYIRGTQAWQTRSSVLDGYVDVLEEGQWVRVGTIHNDYVHLNFPTGWRDTNCITETYYDERFSWCFTAEQTFRSDTVRLVVTRATWGGEVAERDLDSGQGLSEEALSLQSIEVYNTRSAEAAAHSPSPTGPMVIVRRPS